MPPNVIPRDRSNEAKLWCIKVLSGAAYLFKGGKRVEQFRNITGAQETSETSQSTSGSSPTVKKLVQLEFVPSSSGAYKFATLNPRYYNKFGCDDGFDKIENKTAMDLSNEICKALEKLNNATAEALGRDEGSTERSERQCHAQKRPVPQPLTPLFTEGPSRTKKKKGSCEGEISRVKGLEERCAECQLDNSTYFIPIENLALPPKQRQIREVDDIFLKQLVKNMEEQPSGNYEALFVAAKDIRRREEFKTEKIAEYEYEVLGGTHVTLATKHLHEKFPENPNYNGRVARIYIGLKDEEALWLGAMHNHTGSFRHQLTYRDEVEICRTQLFMPAQDCTGDPPTPSDFWRDMCSSLLHKTKRNLSEVFTIAQLSGEGWKHFQTLNTLYEKAKLKGQKTKATDIINKGKPVLRQWQLKPLCKLSTKDQTLLLEKVGKCVMSLDELKCAAAEIKCLRPIQEAIVGYFQMSTWEDVITEFGSTVSPEKLLQFAGKDFEQSHDFQKFLEHLKRKKNGEAVEVTNLLNGKLGALGLIVFSKTLIDVEQNAVAKLPHFQGAFLAIGVAGENCKNASEIIDVISRINFTKLTSFNIVLFTVVEDVKTLADKMLEKGATLTQSGHFYVQNKPQSRSQGPYMTESLNTFVIGHWSVSRQISSRHFSLSNSENLIFVEHVPSQCTSAQPLPVEAYTWLIKHLSREGDTVVDVESDTGYPVTAALKQGRSAVWINTASHHEEADLQTRIANLVSAET